MAELAKRVQKATEQSVKLAHVDQGHTRAEPKQTAAEQGIEFEVVKLPEAKRGFALLPGLWVVERSFAWVARFRRLAKGYERLEQPVAGLHFVVFSILMLAKAARLALISS